MKRGLGICAGLLTALALTSACGGDDDATPATKALGAECEKYVGKGGCCLETAGDFQMAKDACATLKKSVEGGDPATYEMQCKTANDAAKLAGKCTGGGADGGTDGGGNKLGPSCEKYYGDNGCCVELAMGDPSVEQACSDTKDTIESSGVADQTEASCQHLLETAQQGGSCQNF